MFVIGWIVVSIVVGAAATSKGRSFFGYFLLALLLSPLIGFLVLLVVPSLKPPPTAPTAQSTSPMPAGVVGGRSTGKSLAILVGICVAIALLAGIINRGSSPSSTSSSSRPAPQQATATSPASPTPSSQPNRPLTGVEIMEAQQHLFDLGFDPGPRDGIAGTNTITAVKRYETSRGWTATGALDIRLLEFLRAQTGNSKSSPPASTSTVTTSPATANPASEEMQIAIRAIRDADHPCPAVVGAQRVSDGSVRAVCTNGEIYRVSRLQGKYIAMRCSAAERMGITGC